MKEAVEDRRIETGIEELVGGAAPPDCSAVIAERHANGELGPRVSSDGTPRRRFGPLAAAAVLAVGLAVVISTAVLDRSAQHPEVVLEPIAFLELFDMTAEPELFERERLRLLAWLARDDNRRTVLAQPAHVHRFNRAPQTLGGPTSSRIHWFPFRARLGRSVAQWEPQLRTVPLFDVASPHDPDSGSIELIAIDVNAWRATTSMFDMTKLVKSVDERGEPALRYELRPEHKAAYRDWSEELIGKMCAIVVDGVIVSTPRFMSAIFGAGQIVGITGSEIDDLLGRLRTAAPNPVLDTARPDRRAVRAILDGESVRKRFVTELGDTLTFEQIERWIEADDDSRLRRLDGSTVDLHGFVLPTDQNDGRAAVMISSMWRFGFAEPPDPRLAVNLVATADLGSFAGRFCHVAGMLRLDHGRMNIDAAEVRAIDHR